MSVPYLFSKFPTSRIYLAGAQITHLKSGEWVIAGPNTRLTDARLARVVAAINDRGDISCMRIARPKCFDPWLRPVAELHTLRWLFIEDSAMNDEALAHFATAH